MDQKQNEIQAKGLIRKNFPYLFDRGYEFYDSGYTLTSMGYWEVNLKSEKVKLKFYYDYGEIVLILGPNDNIGKYWFDLGLIIYRITDGKMFIGKFEENLSKSVDEQYERLSRYVNEYLSEIEQLLGEPQIEILEEMTNFGMTYMDMIIDSYSVNHGKWVKKVN